MREIVYAVYLNKNTAKHIILIGYYSTIELAELMANGIDSKGDDGIVREVDTYIKNNCHYLVQTDTKIIVQNELPDIKHPIFEKTYGTETNIKEQIYILETEIENKQELLKELKKNDTTLNLKVYDKELHFVIGEYDIRGHIHIGERSIGKIDEEGYLVIHSKDKNIELFEKWLSDGCHVESAGSTGFNNDKYYISTKKILTDGFGYEIYDFEQCKRHSGTKSSFLKLYKHNNKIIMR